MYYETIRFYEGPYCIRSLAGEEEKLKAARLRHEVFCENLKWVPPCSDGLETDEYDPFSMAIGVFSAEEELLGVFRFLPPSWSFMLEREFAPLLAPGYRVRKEWDTAEVTRFTVAPDLRHHGISPGHISRLMYKGMYQWSLENDVRYIYVAVERRFLRALVIAGYPYEAIGPVTALPPAGAESVAAILDWENFRSENREKRATLLEWIETRQPASVPMHGQWLGRASSYPASPKYYARGISPSAR
jgi:N-acyl-L-homoserine lactone synthetase